MAVFPVPVAPSRTVSRSPAGYRRSISAIALGWSPDGTMSVTTSNGAMPLQVTNWSHDTASSRGRDGLATHCISRV